MTTPAADDPESPAHAPHHRTAEELEAGLDHVRGSPADDGPVVLLVRRPRENEREVLAEAELSVTEGLVGDCWTRSPDGGNPDTAVTLMNVRVVELVAGPRERWPLAGDQIYVDLDLSFDNLPPGTRLAVGTAVVEVTAHPHLGCRKFARRFGREANAFVNGETGVSLNLRGVNCRVVEAGRVAVGDRARRLSRVGP